MSERYLDVAVCQMTSVDDIDSNYQQIESLVQQAQKTPARLLCFPENSLYMRIKEGEVIQGIPLDHEVFTRLAQLSAKTGLYLHLGSVAVRAPDGKISNASVLLAPGKAAAIVYEKIHLFDIELENHPPVRESDIYQRGLEPKVLELLDWRLGQSICYDLRFSELYSAYAKQQVGALLVPSSFLVPTGKVHWHILLQARAIESQAYVIAAAQAGTHRSRRASNTRFTFGHSLVVDPWGAIVAETQTEEPQVLHVRLDLQRVQTVRLQIPMHSHRRL